MAVMRVISVIRLVISITSTLHKKMKKSLMENFIFLYSGKILVLIVISVKRNLDNKVNEGSIRQYHEIYLGNAGNSSNTYNWDLVTTMGRRLLQSFSSFI